MRDAEVEPEKKSTSLKTNGVNTIILVKCNDPH